MNRTDLRRAILVIVALGIIVRLAVIPLHPSLHPDEFFQYVEPAWWHLHGYGWPAWEWGIGLRSWVLPAYNGAWIVLLEWIGLGRPTVIHGFLQMHWAIASGLIIPAAADAGLRMSARNPALVDAADATPRAIVDGWAGAVFAAVATAGFPLLIYYAPHTLSEVPSMILFVWGYDYWIRARSGTRERTIEHAFVAGVLLSAGACLRIANGPLAALPALDFLLRRRWRPLMACVAGALAPFVVFAAIDWITWSEPLHSTIEYVKFNTNGAAARFGASPPSEYVVEMVDELGWPGLAALALPVLLEIRAVWTWASGALLLLSILSAQEHKENRFILVVWALLIVAGGTSLGRLVARDWSWGSRRARWAIALALALIVVGENVVGLTRLPAYKYVGRWPLYQAQAWVGGQSDLTGVLIGPKFAAGGGWAMLGRNVPMESFKDSLLDDPLFNYFVVKERSGDEDACLARGAREVWKVEDFVVLRR